MVQEEDKIGEEKFEWYQQSLRKGEKMSECGEVKWDAYCVQLLGSVSILMPTTCRHEIIYPIPFTMFYTQNTSQIPTLPFGLGKVVELRHTTIVHLKLWRHRCHHRHRHHHNNSSSRSSSSGNKDSDEQANLLGKINFYFELHFNLIDSNQICDLFSFFNSNATTSTFSISKMHAELLQRQQEQKNTTQIKLDDTNTRMHVDSSVRSVATFPNSKRLNWWEKLIFPRVVRYSEAIFYAWIPREKSRPYIEHGRKTFICVWEHMFVCIAKKHGYWILNKSFAIWSYNVIAEIMANWQFETFFKLLFFSSNFFYKSNIGFLLSNEAFEFLTKIWDWNNFLSQNILDDIKILAENNI